MTIHQRFSALSRREFLKESAAGLTLAFTLTADPLRVAEALADEPLAASAWISIATDGSISIVSPAAEIARLLQCPARLTGRNRIAAAAESRVSLALDARVSLM